MGDTRQPRPEAPNGLTVGEWQVLYPKGTVPRWVLTRHLLVLGETGSGKSVSTILPLLAALIREPPEHFGGVLVIDPKEELAPMLAREAPQRLEHLFAETLVLNVMTGKRWSIDDDLAAKRWSSASNSIMLRAASFLPNSPLRVRMSRQARGGNVDFFDWEGSSLLGDVLAFVLMLTAADAPPRHDWIDEKDEESLDWVRRLGERARAHHDGGRGPNALALCYWAITETALTRYGGHGGGWLFARLARHAERVWGAEPGEGQDLLRRVNEAWQPLALDGDRHYLSSLSTARVACIEFASSRVARSLYFGCEPGWRDARASAVDLAKLVSPEGAERRFVLYQPEDDPLDALVRGRAQGAVLRGGARRARPEETR